MQKNEGFKFCTEVLTILKNGVIDILLTFFNIFINCLPNIIQFLKNDIFEILYPLSEGSSDRKRRSPDIRSSDEKFFDLGGGIRLNDDPLKALRRITYGNGKWAKAYVPNCKVQPRRQQQRARKWFPLLKQKFTDRLEEMQGQ